MHLLELNLKHETTKFGLHLLFNLTPVLNHDGDIIKALKVNSQINKLKEKIASNPRYLQEKVKEYFKDNRHKLIITMEPDPIYEEKQAAIEKKNLEQKVKNLNENDKKRIFEDGKKLAEVQKAKEDINCLPCLRIDDITTPERHELKFIKVRDVSLQCCPTDTNGIVYFRGMLDASSLEEDERKLLPLFTEIVTQFGTEKYSYQDFDNLVNSKTAGLSFNVHLSENINDYSTYELGVHFGSYALKKNSQDMFNIFAELINSVNFNDPKRFEMLLENYVSSLAVGIAQSGHMYAINNASGLVSESCMLREAMMGLEHNNYIKKLIEQKGIGHIHEMIKNISNKLFSKSPNRCALNVSPNELDENVENVEKFIQNLPLEKSDVHWNRSSLLNSNSRHNIMNIPINFCAKSLATVPYVHQDYPKLRVLARLLSSKYLLPVVREQNGAYGAGAKLSFDGMFSFFSYRDPNSTATIETFNKTYNFVINNMGTIIDEQALFESKLGVLQQLDAPISKMEMGVEHFKYGVSHEIFTEHRDRVLRTSLRDIKEIAEIYLKDDTRTFVGKSIIGPKNEETSNSKWIINEA